MVTPEVLPSKVDSVKTDPVFKPDLRSVSACLQSGLPAGSELEFLQEWFGSNHQIAELLNPFLLPIREYLNRPGKHVRAQLVLTGFELVRRGTKPDSLQVALLESLSSWVETLHAGSLIVDDIQDASPTRRDGPALHEVIGTASAINSANWLYFWPADRLSRLKLPAEIELRLYQSYHQMMSRAHLGQALDLDYDMTTVTRETARAVSMAAMNLKTGELMAMSCEFGAIAATADPDDQNALSEFGRSFGLALQMFNDLSEVRKMSDGREARTPLIRPSLIWQVAAEMLTEADFQHFQKNMKAEKGWDDGFLNPSHPVMMKAHLVALQTMNESVSRIRKHFHSSASLTPIEELAEKVIHGYK